MGRGIPRVVLMVLIAALLSQCKSLKEEKSSDVTASASADAVTSPYHIYIKDHADALRDRFSNPTQLIKDRYVNQVIEMAAVQAMIWQWTNEPRYRDESLRILRAFVDHWQISERNGKPSNQDYGNFFVLYPLMRTFEILESSLSTAEKDKIKTLADIWSRPQQRGDNNQAVYRAMGTALALKHFALNDKAAKQKYLNNVWQDWAQFYDTTENATGYNGIFMTCVIALAEQLGRTSELSNPKVKALAERFRNQVAPSGHIPSFGDDGEKEPLRATSSWPAVFEYFAKAFNDGSFKTAAQKVFEAEKGAPMDGVRPAQYLFLLSNVVGWVDSSLQPKPLSVKPGINRRSLHFTDTEDKLILGNSDDASFVMADLYARGHHSHREQAGAVVWYEYGDTIFLNSLGYHNRLPEHANQLLVQKSRETFPLDYNRIKPGYWQSAKLPTSRLKQDASGKRIVEKWRFRIQHEAGAEVKFYIRNLKLVGPAGEKVIDDFRGGRRRNTDLIESANGWSNRIAIQSAREFLEPVRFDAPGASGKFVFDPKKYTHITFDWAMSDNAVSPYNHFLLLLRTSEAEYDYIVNIKPYDPQLTLSRFEELPSGIQFGTYTYAKHGEAGGLWRRNIALLKQGVMVVLDTYRLDQNAGEFEVGPAWHFVVPNPPRQFADYFVSADFWRPSNRAQKSDVSLVTKFYMPEGRELGMQTKVLWKEVKPHTLYAVEKIKAGEFKTFVTVHVPAKANFEKVAERINIVEQEGQFIITAPVGEAQVVLKMKDDSLEVVR